MKMIKILLIILALGVMHGAIGAKVAKKVKVPVAVAAKPIPLPEIEVEPVSENEIVEKGEATEKPKDVPEVMGDDAGDGVSLQPETVEGESLNTERFDAIKKEIKKLSDNIRNLPNEIITALSVVNVQKKGLVGIKSQVLKVIDETEKGVKKLEDKVQATVELEDGKPEDVPEVMGDEADDGVSLPAEIEPEGTAAPSGETEPAADTAADAGADAAPADTAADAAADAGADAAPADATSGDADAAADAGADAAPADKDSVAAEAVDDASATADATSGDADAAADAGADAAPADAASGDADAAADAAVDAALRRARY